MADEPNALTHAVTSALEAMLQSGEAAADMLERLSEELPRLGDVLRASGEHQHLLDTFEQVLEVFSQRTGGLTEPPAPSGPEPSEDLPEDRAPRPSGHR